MTAATAPKALGALHVEADGSLISTSVLNDAAIPRESALIISARR